MSVKASVFLNQSTQTINTAEHLNSLLAPVNMRRVLDLN